MNVVDLSTDVSGRFAAKLFAMADVDVVRPKAYQDDAQPDMEDFLTLYLDAGKRIVPIKGDGDLSRLLADADLVFTSFDCGKYTASASLRHQLSQQCIQVTTSSFGCTGPYSSFRGGPLADWAAGGYLALTGEPGKEPLIGPETLCAYAGGYTAALAAEAALRERRISGKGQHVDISTMEAMLGLHQSTFSTLAAGFVRQRTGRYAEVYPLVVRPCKDGYVSLGVVTDEDFDRLAIAFGMPDLASDDRFATKEARWENRDQLDQELAEFLDSHAADEVVAVLQANAVASTKVANIRQVLANPQLRHREFWASPDCATGAYMPGNPVPASIVFANPGGPSELNPHTRLLGQRATKHLPLAGMRVIDFSAFWAGPSATAFLADLGADVIWVERPKSRIDFDAHIAKPGAIAQYLYHQKLNRHKRSVVLDLGTAAGLEAARRLAGSADIVIENFRSGVANRLGLGPSQLCTANPKLIYISLSGFGSGGPWGEWRSFGPNIEAASSIMDRTGYNDGEPMRLGHALPDGIGGVVGALAALRGLRERDDRGHGGWFDLSQLESYAALSGEDVLAASMGNKPFPRIANRSRTGAIQGVFPCKGDDEWIAIRLTGASDVERFVAATGLTPLASAPVAAENHNELHRLIWAYTETKDKGALSQLLQRAGVEAFPALTPPELMEDPHLAERGYFYSLPVGDRRYLLPGTPVHGDRKLADPVGRAPRFDEHTKQILRELGMNRCFAPI